VVLLVRSYEHKRCLRSAPGGNRCMLLTYSQGFRSRFLLNDLQNSTFRASGVRRTTNGDIS